MTPTITPEALDKAVELALTAIRAEEARILGGYKTPDNGARRQTIKAGILATLPELHAAPAAAGVPKLLGRDDPRWIKFSDRWPPQSAARDDASVVTTDNVLVTNNIDARDRMGRMSHVWWVSPCEPDRGDCEVVAFTDNFRKIHGLTHWFDPFAPAQPAEQPQAEQHHAAWSPFEAYRNGWRAGVDRIAMHQGASIEFFTGYEDAQKWQAEQQGAGQ